LLVRLVRAFAAAIVALLAIVGLYAANVFAGMHVAAQTAGEIRGLEVRRPVQIVRDARDVPHIRARSLHDLFFAQGYAEGSDRLFQMDLVRRFVYGKLAEVLGSSVVSSDERSRIVDVRGIVAREWQRVSPNQQAAIQAFSDGVNAAMQREPLPVEFRLLLYRPQAWTPQDSLAVGFATVLDLNDSWDEVLRRDPAYRAGPAVYAAFYPLTDPKYDVPLVGRDTHRTSAVPAARFARELARFRPRARLPIGSNEWAVGGTRTRSGRALLANDPHLSLAIPGIWYLVDLQAPGFHAAGASIAGTPGIILGHNERVAWGATNGTVASLSVYRSGALSSKYWVTETFHVRFGRDVTRRYYRAPHEFGVPASPASKRIVLVRWSAYDEPNSPVAAFLSLDRATSSQAAIGVLARYPGPTQNFVIADTGGTAAYHLAGIIPNDPAWARYVHPATDLHHTYGTVPFTALPGVAPSRDAVVFTANNKMYGDGYRYRLSATFDVPYRAYRIHQMLAARKTYDAAYFERMQLDTYSPAEFEFARDLARSSRGRRCAGAFAPLQNWDGRYAANANGATLAQALRIDAVSHAPNFTAVLEAFRSGGNRAAATRTALCRDVLKNPQTFARESWGTGGAVTITHQLDALGISFLNGARLPGDGDKYTIHVQSPGFSQSFRAVWDVGNWDGGGIVIPSGESGEPGSHHYTDLSGAWIAGRIQPLPFGARAVDASARERLILLP
jgi:penicillin amidase